MIRGITAQGERVGQNLMRGTYTSENGHKDLLHELKKKKKVSGLQGTSVFLEIHR